MRLLELSNGLHELAGIKHMPSIRLYRALTAIGASARTIGNSCCQSFSVHLHHACPIEELQHPAGSPKSRHNNAAGSCTAAEGGEADH